jgi:hypothetical protein
MGKEKPPPDLSEHEEEAHPLKDVLKQLLEAKPSPKKQDRNEKPKTK